MCLTKEMGGIREREQKRDWTGRERENSVPKKKGKKEERQVGRQEGRICDHWGRFRKHLNSH